ncbi:MAG: DNA-processing protein DprA [Ginsengibacter sp.]
MNQELLFQIALTMIPNIGDVHRKLLITHFGDPGSVFKAKKRELELMEGIGVVRAKSIKDFSAFKDAEKEITFIEKFRITPLFINEPSYPRRLLNCYDNPVLLYYRGTANLNSDKIIAIVGTRNNNEYGKNVCERFIEEIRHQNILVVSGLAFGIDSIAHRTALKHGLPTVGVLAHGLDRIYPAENKLLAKHMIESGGLLTDFRSGTNPDKQNFPKRNRIVAGISDAVVVIETGLKGGSLITAELANGYNKDVFAIPGRISDPKNEGCNYLIKTNKASLITSANDVLENMGWNDHKKNNLTKQRKLFIDLTGNEKIIDDILQAGPTHIDEIFLRSGLSSSAVAAALLTLEMQNLVISLPGKIYELS